jgi:2-methylisocitrate lyase-like PEP mutase family enzyme
MGRRLLTFITRTSRSTHERHPYLLLPKADFMPAQVLADLLERLDHSRVPVDATQYRSVVLHLEGVLKQLPSDGKLRNLLDTHPAAAQMYENLHYAHSGLVRSPLEQSLSAERLARDAIQRAMRTP